MASNQWIKLARQGGAAVTRRITGKNTEKVPWARADNAHLDDSSQRDAGTVTRLRNAVNRVRAQAEASKGRHTHVHRGYEKAYGKLDTKMRGYVMSRGRGVLEKIDNFEAAITGLDGAHEVHTEGKTGDIVTDGGQELTDPYTGGPLRFGSRGWNSLPQEVREELAQSSCGQTIHHTRVRRLMHIIEQMNPTDVKHFFEMLDKLNEIDRSWGTLPLPQRKYLEELVRRYRPQVALDIGSFCHAQSALAIHQASLMSCFVITLEKHQLYADAAYDVVEKCGCKAMVKVICINSGNVLKPGGGLWDPRANYRTGAGGPLGTAKFDFVFMDQIALDFQRDLEALLEQKRLRPGAVIVSNVAIGTQYEKANGVNYKEGTLTDDPMGSRTAEFMSWVLRDPRFKVRHCPPTQLLHVAEYLGEPDDEDDDDI